MATETLDPPAEGNLTENATIKASMSKWMQGLAHDLPNPSLGQGAQEAPVVPPVETPEPPAEPPVTQPATAPPPPPAKPTITEAPPVGTDETRWPRSAKEWKNFTTAQKTKEVEWQKQLADRDARIKEFEAKVVAPGAVDPAIQKQLDELKKENDEYSKQLRLVAVTTHPKFKSYFETKTNSTLGALKSCVPVDQLDSVTKLVQSPDTEAKEEAINSLMENMTTLQRGRFVGVLNSLSSIQAEREGEVARAQQDYEQIVANAKTEQEQKRNGFTKMLDDTVKGMQDAKAGRPEYQLREGETEWNNSVQKRIEMGRQLITGNLKPETMFKAAFDAAAYPDVLSGYRAALGEVDKLKKQIAAMSAASPRIEPTKRAASATEPTMPKDSRPMDYTTKWVQKFGEAMRGEAA
jgi:hypothetical protein